jgi:hypothetical protein
MYSTKWYKYLRFKFFSLCAIRLIDIPSNVAVSSGVQQPKSLTFGLIIRLFDVKQYLTNEKEQTEIVITTKITRFGSWNVRSCYHITKRELIVRQLKRYQIEVVVLAETNIPDSGIY